MEFDLIIFLMLLVSLCGVVVMVSKLRWVNLWMGLLALTVFSIVAMLTIVPLGDMSYTCDSAYSLLREPAAEFPHREFFDTGQACNADARQRGRVTSAAAVLGTAATAGAFLWQRRRHKDEGPGTSRTAVDQTGDLAAPR